MSPINWCGFIKSFEEFTMLGALRKHLGGALHQLRSEQALRKVLDQEADFSALKDWGRSLSDPTNYYLDCVRFFHGPQFPEELKKHRRYFLQDQRGFGEDAFHVLWWMLFRKMRPKSFLEIGVYRGQTLSLAALLQHTQGIEGSVTGISPFSPAGDAVSTYREHLDYLQDTQLNFRAFGLPAPELVRAYSTDQIATNRIRQEAWDAVYIDGNHDYEVARADWSVCSASINRGGIIVLDDAALGTAYNPPRFATAGHHGPSRLATESDAAGFREILRVGHNRVFQKQ
jgi:predicted O-methyltransferase YrrM